MRPTAQRDTIASLAVDQYSFRTLYWCITNGNELRSANRFSWFWFCERSEFSFSCRVSSLFLLRVMITLCLIVVFVIWLVCVDANSLSSVPVGMLSPRNLRVSDEWYTRFRVSWEPVSAPVQGYRLIYSPKGERCSHRALWPASSGVSRIYLPVLCFQIRTSRWTSSWATSPP